jgi:hypothetical protein
VASRSTHSGLASAIIACIVLAPLGAHLAIAVCGDRIPDPAEECDRGDSRNGAPDSCCTSDCRLRPTSYECRSSKGACDEPDFCDGDESGRCPFDQKSSKMCRPADPANSCDVEERCDNVGDACPADGRLLDQSRCLSNDPCLIAGQCVAGKCVGDTRICEIVVEATPQPLALEPGEAAFLVRCKLVGLVPKGDCDARAFLPELGAQPIRAPGKAVDPSCPEQGTLPEVTKPFERGFKGRRKRSGRLRLNDLAKKARERLPDATSDDFVTCATVTTSSGQKITLRQLIRRARRRGGQ